MEFAKGIKPLSGAKDWPAWKDRVLDLLSLYNVVDIVEGRSLSPDPPAKSASATQKEEINKNTAAWKKAASQAKIIISQTISDDLHCRIAGRLSASEAWKVLVREFDDKAEDQIFHECLSFFNADWKDDELAGDVLSHIKNQYRDFSVGIENRKINIVEQLLELLFVSKVLHILPKRFKSFKSSYLLLNSKNDKKLSDLGDALIMHERNVNPVQDSNLSHEALYTHPSKNQKIKSNDIKKKNSDVVCKYCGMKGHSLKKCFKWIKDGKPPSPARANDSVS